MFELPFVFGFKDKIGMLMMIVGDFDAFYSSQCAQNIGNIVYFRTKNKELVRFDVTNKDSVSVITKNVRDFKVEENGDITVLGFDNTLKRLNSNAMGQVIKSIQLQNGNSTSTHWTTFCRLGKHTCVAGHDSKTKRSLLANVFDLQTQMPVVAEVKSQYNCKLFGEFRSVPIAQIHSHFRPNTFRLCEWIRSVYFVCRGGSQRRSHCCRRKGYEVR